MIKIRKRIYIMEIWIKERTFGLPFGEVAKVLISSTENSSNEYFQEFNPHY